MTIDRTLKDAVLRAGEVTEVAGRKIVVRVDRNKNASDLLFDGDVLRNISVNSYVEIRKGFTSLVGKVDGERLDDASTGRSSAVQKTNRTRRFLEVTLSGYFNQQGRFVGGLRELPLIGNEVFVVTKRKLEAIHDLVEGNRTAIKFGVTDNEGFDVAFPVDGLFNSHIAIFGNTGSGKSNTLASLYAAFVNALTQKNRKKYNERVRVALLDFNGEYTGGDCITSRKHVYHVRTDGFGNQIPLSEEVLTNIDMLGILAEATDKTQKPFLRRVISLYRRIFSGGVAHPSAYFATILKEHFSRALQMSDKQRADTILDYFKAIFSSGEDDGETQDVRAGLEWHNVVAGFFKPNTSVYYAQRPDLIPQTIGYQMCESFTFGNNLLSRIIALMYSQLIGDILSNRAQNEHIAPVINRLVARRFDIENIFDTSGASEFWKSNFVVINLDAVGIDMKKMIPLLLAKRLYQEHKTGGRAKSLTLIIDEAHNILSTASFRETEGWKDYRLETFEEIIKEGRKFGVFVTISSQRPNDISPTITSQAHNYFIHRLVNQKDLATISSAVSYIDKMSEASIPTLPVGTCIFSGVAGQMPLKIRVKPLVEGSRPRSHTLSFDDILER